MNYTDTYKEHIMYTFNAFCKVVIRYAAINAWRDRDKRRQREISFEYLTEEKFYPFSTSDKCFIDPYKQYPVTVCGQTIILTNGELAVALSALPKKKREVIYLYFFGRYTQQCFIKAKAIVVLICSFVILLLIFPPFYCIYLICP